MPLAPHIPLLAAAAALLGLALRPALRAFALWTLLLAAGQRALLELTRAGPGVGYQHLRPALERPAEWAALGVLGLQAAAVALGLIRRRAAVAHLLRRLGAWRAAALAAVAAVAAAKLAHPAEAFLAESAASALAHLLAVANVGLAVAALPDGTVPALARFGERLLGPVREGPEPGGPDRFALAVAAAAVTLTALLCVAVYQRHPHVPDEVVYLLHARMLAAGALWLPAPPVPAGFDVDLMLLAGERWYCPVPIGWPLALAVGTLAGVPWLVNPLLSGACVLLAYALVREFASRRTARILALLMAASPWFLFLGMSFMTHAFSMAATLLGALGVARARRTGAAAWGWLAGAGVGAASLVRPLDGLVLALLLGLWALGLGAARIRWAALAGLVLGAAAVGGLTLPYNALMTGSARQFPIVEYVDRVYRPGANDLGFGPDRGLDWGGLDPWPGHTPFQALVNAQFNAFALDVELLGWASGSLLPLALALLLRARRREDRWMWSVLVATVGANSLYWFAGGPDFGARYWYAILLPSLWLVLSGLRGAGERLGTARVGPAAAVLSLVALVVFVPWRASDRYAGYRGMRPGAAELMQRAGAGRSLVLVRGRRHPDYASAAVHNPLDWNADGPIFAWDRDDSTRRALLEHYADRPVWILDGPTLASGTFRLAAGPLDARELLAKPPERPER